MNAVLSLSHFCETHGPSILFSTQAFHFAGDVHCGILKPSGIQFFGCLTKLGESIAGKSPNVNNRSCEACESVSGYITNDYENKISFLSTRLAIDSNVSSLLKQAAVRSLSCEVVPGKEGQVYFGDSVRGHVLSNTFFLKDSQARGFHRWYSIVVFMKDKHFLLNSWSFFHQHINQIVLHLQRQATQVYSNEQSACSQRALRLSFLDQKHSSARSLIKLTASTNVFAQLHLWFSWLLSMGAKRLEEHLPKQILDSKSQEREAERYDSIKKNETSEEDSKEEDIIYHLKQLRHIFGPYNFQKLLYSTLIGRQVVVRGPKIIVETIINSLKLFYPPAGKFCCQKFGNTYKTPDICNIIGLDLSAAVPKSSNSILRLDIVPLHEIGTTTMTDLDAIYKFHNFIVKNDSELPEKLPSLLVKIDKCLSDENLSNRVVWLHIKSLMEQWFHVAKVVRELKKKENEVYITSGVMQSLGVQEQDNQLIEFWTS